MPKCASVSRKLKALPIGFDIEVQNHEQGAAEINMQRFIEQHSDEQFDIVIVGGGITGACVAYEAATQGLKVALLEKGDFSGGTSSASSKLIHGGLRYLVNGEFGMVRESLRERRVMANIAPNLVYPAPVLISHSKQSFIHNKWLARAGMLLYDALSYDKSFTWDRSKRIPMHSTLSRQAVLQSEPQICAQGLTGGTVYYDSVNLCPERLNLAFIQSAVRDGAKVSNHAQVSGLLQDGAGRVSGVQVRDVLSGEQRTVRARLTVNCAGPWADRVLQLASSRAAGERSLRRSEGVHFISRKPLISGKYIVGCASRSGGHFFLIPWRGHTLVGTTDKAYSGEPDNYRVSAASVMELIATVNQGFGDGTLSYADVQYAYGGLRPLVENQTRETYTASRRYEICDNAEQGVEGLITAEGGKWTTSRQLASDCLKLVARKLGLRLGPSSTNKQRLAGCDITDLTSFLAQAQQQNRGFATSTIDFLSRHYGTDFEAVLQLARDEPRLAQTLDADGEILAQVSYAIRFEMARTLSDIVLRRTGIGTLGHPGTEVLEKVAALAASELAWDEARKHHEIAITAERLMPPLPQAESSNKAATD
jgi:glycerol-3-phosphate dehydrogenase